MRICIVADNASARFGGEAVLPLRYFRQLRQRGVEVWLVVHDRCRAELESLLPEEQERTRFVPDTAFHRVLFRLSGLLPRRVAESTVGLLMLMYTQWTQRRVLRQLIREHGIDVLHQPAPVAPSYPSMFFGLGMPLIIGPMNGSMDYPPAFRSAELPASRIFVGLARSLTALVNLLLPGSETPPCCWWPIRGRPLPASGMPRPRREFNRERRGPCDLEDWQLIDAKRSKPIRLHGPAGGLESAADCI